MVSRRVLLLRTGQFKLGKRTLATSLPQKSLLSKNVRIGVGIGVSLCISVILILAIVIIHERRLLIKAQEQVGDTLAAYDKSRATGTHVSRYQIQGQSRPQEFEHTGPSLGEPYDGDSHETCARG